MIEGYNCRNTFVICSLNGNIFLVLEFAVKLSVSYWLYYKQVLVNTQLAKHLEVSFDKYAEYRRNLINSSTTEKRLFVFY